MPLSFQDFVQRLRTVPVDATDEQKLAAVKGEQIPTSEPTLLGKAWDTVNRPIAGSSDALVPQLRHEHAPDESGMRKVVEDFAAGLTSPLNVGATALGVGGSMAGKAGKLGISNAARVGEAALQAPLVAEGVLHAEDAPTVGGKAAGVLEAGLGAHGVKSSFSHAFDPTAVRDTFMKEHQLTPAVDEPLDPAKAMKTADDYLAMAHAPNDPEVAKSYDALTKEIAAQHDFLVNRAGVKIEPFTGEGEPYKNSDEMRKDVLNNNHLFYLKTDKSLVAPDHPMMQGDLNDQFRAVHDYFGHVVEPSGFGPKGEQSAYNAHRDTVSPDAVPALATETKGQNSVVNFGPHMRDAQGTLLPKDQQLPLTERPFSQQKAGILPEFRQPDPHTVERLTDAAPTGNAKPALSLDTPPAKGFNDFMEKFGGKAPATAASIVGPLASSQIDDSDPNDPNQKLKHYAKLGLDLAALAGPAAIMAPIRSKALSSQKAAALKGAAYLVLGEKPTVWAKRMVDEGVSAEDLPKVRAASEKIFNQQLQKADGQMPNAKKLLQHYQNGSAEAGWYDDTHKELTDLFGKDAPLMANLLAATSVNATVKSNTSMALKAYGHIKAGRDLDNLKPGEGFLPAALVNVKRAAAGEPLAGRKVDNFAKAIAGDPNAVVVDRWMLRAFGIDAQAATPHEYDVIEHAVNDLAKRQGVTPRQMQAAIWFSVKNKAEQGKQRPESPAYGTLLKQKLAPGTLPWQQPPTAP